MLDNAGLQTRALSTSTTAAFGQLLSRDNVTISWRDPADSEELGGSSSSEHDTLILKYLWGTSSTFIGCWYQLDIRIMTFKKREDSVLHSPQLMARQACSAI